MDKVISDVWNIDSEAEYTFYYDESNNIRSFNLQDNTHQFNADFDGDFVLGGIAYKGSLPSSSNIDIETAKRFFGLQKTVKELKFSGQFKGKDFIGVISRKSTQAYLSWLCSSGLLIHFTRVNNLYFALVDILDSITDAVEESEYGFDYFRLKVILYQTLKAHVDELQQIFWDYGYPDIEKDKLSRFINAIMGLFPRRWEMTNEQKFITGCMKRTIENGELAFLEDNDKHIFQDSFAVFYASQVLTYPNSEHYFDEEDEVIKNLKKTSFLSENKNMHFINSKSDIMIQFSDVLVGILGSLSTFINQHTSIELNQVASSMNNDQIKCIEQLRQLYLKSCMTDPGLVCQVTSKNEIDKLESFLQI